MTYLQKIVSFFHHWLSPLKLCVIWHAKFGSCGNPTWIRTCNDLLKYLHIKRESWIGLDFIGYCCGHCDVAPTFLFYEGLISSVTSATGSAVNRYISAVNPIQRLPQPQRAILPKMLLPKIAISSDCWWVV